MADDLLHEGMTAEGYGDELDRVAGDLEDVEAAMRRLDEGTYGRCHRCGGNIPEEELSADPLATACAEHAAPVTQ